MKVKHKKYKFTNETDGEQLIDMVDGEKWKLKNVEIIK